MKDTRIGMPKAVTKPHLNFSAQSPLLADVSNFCAAEIGLVLHVSSVECETGVFLHVLLLSSVVVDLTKCTICELKCTKLR